jgi:hypothetical protein
MWFKFSGQIYKRMVLLLVSYLNYNQSSLRKLPIKEKQKQKKKILIQSSLRKLSIKKKQKQKKVLKF